MHVAVTDNEVICTDVSENMVCCEVLQCMALNMTVACRGCGVWGVEKCPKM